MGARPPSLPEELVEPGGDLLDLDQVHGIRVEPAACSCRCGLSGRLKKRRKKGSAKSGFASSGERVMTEMFTTAGVTSLTSGASVGSPRASVCGCAA